MADNSVLFAVASCRKCSSVRAVEETATSFTCYNCGRVEKADKAKWFARGLKREDVSEAIGRIKIELAGQEQPEEIAYVSSKSHPVSLTSSKMGRKKRTPVEVAEHLSKAGTFSQSIFVIACENEGIKKAEDVLKKLLDSGDIYEPKKGQYLSVV